MYSVLFTLPTTKAGISCSEGQYNGIQRPAWNNSGLNSSSLVSTQNGILWGGGIFKNAILNNPRYSMILNDVTLLVYKVINLNKNDNHTFNAQAL